MSNVKQVDIHAHVPYDLHKHLGLAKKLAFMNSPAAGLSIHYVGPTAHVKNEHGGKTAMYAATITGTEAISIGWLQSLVDELKEVGGKVDSVRIYDIEAQENITLKL